jgi:hypothetical protein
MGAVSEAVQDLRSKLRKLAPPVDDLVAYGNLTATVRKKVDVILEGMASDPAEHLREWIVEHGTDYPLVLAAVRAAVYRQHLPHRQAASLMNLLAVRIKGRRRSLPKNSSLSNTRGRLPFSTLPKPKETEAEFIARWERSNGRRKRYPAGMIDWETGEINWDDEGPIYGFDCGSKQHLIYRALLEGPVTYEDLRALAAYGKRIHGSTLNSTLKRIMVEPGALPPGAGVYHEDAEAGKMWIARDPVKAVVDSLPWREEALERVG